MKTGKILEIGHGPGYLYLQAARSGKNLYGADLSFQMNKLCNRRVKKHNLNPKIVNSDGRHLPFPHKCFNQVIATFPTEYIFEGATLSEINRVLEENGEFIILPVAWITGRNMQEKLFAWIFRVTNQSPDFNTFPLKQLTIRLSESGFLLGSELIKDKKSQVLILTAKKNK